MKLTELVSRILHVVKGLEILPSCYNDVDMRQAVTEFAQKHARVMQRALWSRRVGGVGAEGVCVLPLYHKRVRRRGIEGRTCL
jgi:hypothetical protein